MTGSSQPIARIKVEQDAIAHVLQDKSLNVPIYQRPYSWTLEEITEYWDDIVSSIRTGVSEYFLGTVVVTPDPDSDRISVIDGQQRLATTTMVIAAVTNAYLKYGDSGRANIVETQYLATGELESGDLQPKLKLNEEDDYFFQNTVVLPSDKAKPVTKAYGSHRLVEEAFSFIQQSVEATINQSGSEWQKALSDLINYLGRSVQVILVQVPNESDAFLIFETLNDRGLDLTIADLLKNYLFRLAGPSDLEAVKRRWIAATSVLDTSNNPKTLTNFLRHHWSSTRSLVRDRDLYREMRLAIKTRQQALAYSNEIELESRKYAALLNSDHEYWSELGSGTREDIETLMRLDLEQYRPLLLAAMSEFSNREQQRLIRSLVSWSVRGLIVGGLGGGTVEKAYSDAGRQIRAGTITDADGVYRTLAPIIANDTDFQDSFARARVTKPALARYYLLAFERFTLNQREPELVPNSDEAEVNLEHVYPRNATLTEWPQFSPVDASTWSSRIGNMALMKKTENSRIGNKPFSAKAPILQKSALQWTSEIGVEPDWSPSAIEERQSRMAALAPAIWKQQP